MSDSNTLENTAQNETIVTMETDHHRYQETTEVTPGASEDTGTQDEVTEIEPSFVNTVHMKTKEGSEDRECLRVTVEISHPSLSWPVYRTWTGN